MIGDRLRERTRLIAAVVLCLIGVAAMLFPAYASHDYGIVAIDAPALGWVRACGLRDLALGLIFFVVREPLRPLFLIVALLAAGDLTLVVTTMGWSDGAWRHLIGVVLALGLASWPGGASRRS